MDSGLGDFPILAEFFGEAWVTALVVLVGLIASTLFASGQDGVFRWHQVGPIRLHLSALLSPLILVLAADGLRTRPLGAHGGLAAVQVIHFLQPDAGQATAVGAAAVAITFIGALSTLVVPEGGADGATVRIPASGSVDNPASVPSGALVWRLAPAVVYTTTLVGAWFRTDPLLPAPFVEDIVARAFQVGTSAGVLALLSLVALVVAPFVAGGRALRRHPAPTVALAVYFSASVGATVVGAFPVPLLGFGASPVIGAFVGLAALAGVVGANPRASHDKVGGSK